MRLVATDPYVMVAGTGATTAATDYRPYVMVVGASATTAATDWYAHRTCRGCRANQYQQDR
jgi:hypothetical protein